MEEDSQLLFFETFNHDNEEEHLDLVRFNQWVYITEIRVIPLGARIQAEFGGSNIRLGATNPSKFKLEFFVNDHNKKNVCTFQPFGSMNYQQNVDIQFFVGKKIATDCLVVRGKYKLLTLAIYGYKVTKKKSSPPPSQPTAPREVPQKVQPIVTTQKGGTKYSSDTYPYDYNKSYDPTNYELQSSWTSNPEHIKEEKIVSLKPDEERRVVRRRDHDSSEKYKSERTRSSSGDKPRPTRIDVSKPSPPLPVTKVSRPKTPPDSQPAKEASPSAETIEARSISPLSPSAKVGKLEHHPEDLLGSDVEKISEDEHLETDMVDDEEIAAEYNITIDIYHSEFVPLKYFQCPSLTKFEIQKATAAQEEEALPVRKLLQEFSNVPHTDKWVLAIEALEEIPWGLSGEEFSELVQWVVEGLDRDAALNQPQVLFKVRHIKAGIHLASLLFFTDPSIIQKLLDADVPLKLLDLLEDPHISVFMKLHIMRALDLVLLTQEGLTYLTTKKEQGSTCYQRLVKCFMGTTDSRSAVSLRAILKKIHLNEVLLKLKDSTQVLEENFKDQKALDKSHLEVVNGALVATLDCLTMPKQHLAPPHQYLPAKHQFTIPECSYDPLQMIHRMLKDNHLIKNLATLFFLKPQSQELHKNAHNLLTHLQTSLSGLLFLLSSPEPSEALYQALLQSGALSESLACHLQVLQAVDWLLARKKGMDENGNSYELDDPETVEYLKILNGMVFLASGKQALANVLAMEKTLDALLPFLQFTADDNHNEKLTKSVSLGYATELLLLTVHFAENVSYLQHYKSLFLQFESQDQVPKLQELSKWLLPYKDINIFTTDCIPVVMNHIKDMQDQAENLPIEMILGVRILKALVAAENSSELENMEELKHKYALYQIYGHDGLSIFLHILQGVHKAYLQPFHPLSGHQGASLLALVGPIINLVNLMLSYVIQSRGPEFQDLTPIFTLLHIHSLMALVPLSTSAITAIQTQVLDTLLAYTQPSLDSIESDDALSQSLWTKMLREVLRFTVLSPSNFMTGLSILIDLLPQMLPLPTSRPLSEKEMAETVSHRKLWSAHLLPLSVPLYEMIQSLCTTTSTSMSSHLRRVCLQLCDLAMPTALIVLRAVLDAIESQSPDLKDLSPVSTRILHFVSYLIGHASFKMPFLALWKGAIKAEEKYVEVINKIVKLSGAHGDRPYQEALMIILQALCDPEVGYGTSQSDTPQVLACNLPGPQHLALLISSLLHFIGRSKPNPNYLLFALRTLLMLTDHDYGYYQLKQGLELHPESLYALLCTCRHMNTKDNPEGLNVISTTLDLIRQLFHSEVNRMSISQLRKVLRWNPKDHPLLELKQTEMGDDELIKMLNGQTEVQDSRCSSVEPELPSPDCSSRAIYIVQEDLEEDPETFPEPADQEMEPAELDLLAISEKYCPKFDLRQELESLSFLKTSNQGSTSDKLQLKRPLEALNSGGTVSEVVMKKPFIAPMRGSGLVTRGAPHSSRPNDPFRSRPPNTSRPPSTHVDDFFAFDGGNNAKKDSQPRGRGGRGVGPFVQGTRGKNYPTPGSSTYLPRREPAQIRTFWPTRNSSSKSRGNFGGRASLQDATTRGLLPTPRGRESSPPLQIGGNRLSRTPGHWAEHRFDSTQGRRDIQARHSRSFGR